MKHKKQRGQHNGNRLQPAPLTTMDPSLAVADASVGIAGGAVAGQPAPAPPEPAEPQSPVPFPEPSPPAPFPPEAPQRSPEVPAPPPGPVPSPEPAPSPEPERQPGTGAQPGAEAGEADDGWPARWDEEDAPVAAEESGWARDLRRMGRIGVWALPLGAIGLAVSGLWGWPQPGVASSRPGSWLVVTLGGLALSLLGSMGLVSLLAATRARRYAIFAAVSAALGTVLTAAVLGVVGLARPAVTNAAPGLGKQAGTLQAGLLDGQVARWLTVAGFTLLTLGLVSLGLAVLASGVLTRVDGWLMLGAAGLTTLSAWLSWQFLLVIAAMALLAAGLGVCWSAVRLTPDGHLRT